MWTDRRNKKEKETIHFLNLICQENDSNRSGVPINTPQNDNIRKRKNPISTLQLSDLTNQFSFWKTGDNIRLYQFLIISGRFSIFPS
jgi:hypothetical protein